MGDFIYDLVCGVGRPIVRITSRLNILHPSRVPRSGAFILASNHLSPFDVPVLMAATPRRLDFLSIVEMKRVPLIGPLFRSMNTIFLDRSRRDMRTTMAAAKKLAAGRAVALFPEGGIQKEEGSVIHGGPFKSGVLRLAAMSGAPIVPCVVLGTKGYRRSESWLPLASVRMDLNFGNPMTVVPGNEDSAGRQLAATYRELANELFAVIQKRNTRPTTPSTPLMLGL